MTHKFEFIIVKKRTEQEVQENKEKEYINLIYETESTRRSKVHKRIIKELSDKKMIQPSEIEDFYLRQLK